VTDEPFFDFWLIWHFTFLNRQAKEPWQISWKESSIIDAIVL